MVLATEANEEEVEKKEMILEEIFAARALPLDSSRGQHNPDWDRQCRSLFAVDRRVIEPDRTP